MADMGNDLVAVGHELRFRNIPRFGVFFDNARDENPMIIGIERAKRGEASSLDFSCGRWLASGVTVNPQWPPHYLGRPDQH